MSENAVAELETEVWELARLKPHPKNPRKHPKKGSVKWEALRKSLEADYFDPMVVNRRSGLLVSGHLRREMLIDLGYQSARVVVKDYDEGTHLARMIAANVLLGFGTRVGEGKRSWKCSGDPARRWRRQNRRAAGAWRRNSTQNTAR